MFLHIVELADQIIGEVAASDPWIKQPLSEQLKKAFAAVEGRVVEVGHAGHIWGNLIQVK